MHLMLLRRGALVARWGPASIEPQGGYFIVAAVVTPADVISQLALANPMYILQAVGIIAAQVFIKHTQAPEDAARAGDKPAA